MVDEQAIAGKALLLEPLLEAMERLPRGLPIASDRPNGLEEARSVRLTSAGQDTRSVVTALIACARQVSRCFALLYAVIFALILVVRLLFFSLLLLPPFLRIGYRYFRDSRIRRGIRFAAGSRRFLDVYCPAAAEAAKEGRGAPVPVVIAVMGGAWCITHRAWNAQLGQRLLEAGVITVAIDYRNFPWAKLPGMLEDIDKGIAWVFNNIAVYGGDPSNVIITGQSAGAHLSTMLMLRSSMAEAQGAADDVELGGERSNLGLGSRWSVRDLRGYVGVSGVYDFPALEEQLRGRGVGPLTTCFLHALCGASEGGLERYSPSHLLRSPEWAAVAAQAALLMPPVLLFHGSADNTVAYSSSTNFVDCLRQSGVMHVEVEVKQGFTHAEPIIESPFRGEDCQVPLLLGFLLEDDERRARLESMPRLRSMWPKCFISLAKCIMPF